ncbi:MAG: Putative deoxyribose-specific ABC transporter, permease protein [uncultured Nocardioidaceae bacterium]|uniref:Deoxyribose-specific ABC transporter, permease protein n=1 Tax=uncultured Nocardioidaceae bacterium TaxID=253824 RepID=A0A6J4LSI3_9ACTN|nr:MAG: Putative deoxyribose-specific ABC transporter, permease protein [uncultured Nocardioidaceae bacterium]
MRLLRNVGYAVLAPVMALLVSLVVTSLVVAAVGSPPGDFWSVVLSWPDERILVNIVNQASMIFISGVAAAIGFRMNLFNIGVEGQYRMASYVAAAFAGAALLPGPLNIAVAIVLAMLTGAAWAAIAAVLKVTRGVSEVISTIMLNAIAVFLVGYFVQRYGQRAGDGRRTTPLTEGSQVTGISPFEERSGAVWLLAVLAVLVGLLFWFVINRTRFGFDLRATGHNESAAVASGVKVRRMVVVSMSLSGAVAGLIWLPNLFEATAPGYYSGSVFQSGLGFTGIAVALLGRNRASGIAVGAVLFAFLNEQSTQLEFARVDVSKDIVAVTQGIIVLAIVVAYEVVRRWRTRREQQQGGTRGSDTAFEPDVGPAGGPREREVPA